MTVPLQPTFKSYTGNGVTTAYPIGFLCLQEGDLAVYVGGLKLTLGDYTITELTADTGGTVTFNVAPGSGVPVFFNLEVVPQRLIDYKRAGDFFANTVNLDFDRIWLAIQQAFGYSGRTLQLGLGDVDGSGSYRGKGNRIQDLGDPLEDQDAVNRRSMFSFVADYVDKAIAGISGGFGWFLQTGISAVYRTFQDKMRDEFNAKDFGVPMDGVTDAAPALNAAVQALNAIGGGVLKIPPGTFIVDSGINLTGCSNITLRGSGWDTIIKCTASLDGSNNSSKNDVIYALNFTGTRPADGYAHKNLIVEDMTIDCSLQSASGVPAAATAGYSLAAVEFMNVDYSHVRRCRIYRAFGNGVAISTYDPRLTVSGVTNGIEFCIVEQNFFEECVRGLLPQYKGANAPDGITGTVIQIGSAVGCMLRDNYVLYPGGPFIDAFNASECQFTGNMIIGTGTTPVGASPTNAILYQQTIGTIRSDFGMRNCTISGNTFRNSGGIFLTGNMSPNFFNGNTPTPGPQNCDISNNIIINQPGARAFTPPAIGASGATYTNPSTQSIQVRITGGAGIACTYRRGTDGTFVSQTLGPGQSLQLACGDAFTMSYTTAPTSWAWLYSPNVFQGAISLGGGSVPGSPTTAAGNNVSGNRIFVSGGAGIACTDFNENQISGNYVNDPGVVRGAAAISFSTSSNEAPNGCSRNSVIANFIKDDRTPPNMTYNFQDDAPGGIPRCLDNTFLNNRLEQGSNAGTVSFASLARQFMAQNFGPGLPGPFLSSPGIPATGVEQANPFPYDCMVYVAGGVVTSIAVGRAGSTFVTGATVGGVRVPQGCVLKLTYTTTPTSMNWFRA